MKNKHFVSFALSMFLILWPSCFSSKAPNIYAQESLFSVEGDLYCFDLLWDGFKKQKLVKIRELIWSSYQSKTPLNLCINLTTKSGNKIKETYFFNFDGNKELTINLEMERFIYDRELRQEDYSKTKVIYKEVKRVKPFKDSTSRKIFIPENKQMSGDKYWIMLTNNDHPHCIL